MSADIPIAAAELPEDRPIINDGAAKLIGTLLLSPVPPVTRTYRGLVEVAFTFYWIGNIC